MLHRSLRLPSPHVKHRPRSPLGLELAPYPSHSTAPSHCGGRSRLVLGGFQFVMELRAHEQAAENAIPSAHVGQRLRHDAEHAERRPCANANSQVATYSVIRISYAHDAVRLCHESNASRPHADAPPPVARVRLGACGMTAHYSPARLEFASARVVSLAWVALRIRPLPVPTQIDSGRHGSLENERAHDFFTSFVAKSSRRAVPFMKTTALCLCWTERECLQLGISNARYIFIYLVSKPKSPLRRVVGMGRLWSGKRSRGATLHVNGSAPQSQREQARAVSHLCVAANGAPNARTHGAARVWGRGRE
ncbi:hypothetical protein C8R45DRAFT_1151401 [Mycena sanguinolenta]|nr:hypothetical protein C8R45DRAFT_1151401 [Mycena sanguinolenta]